ncbi:MAG: hypothetical protein PHG35_02200 [Dehalococcoidales bacterium]|nr:hypothetical protein [Dehalococcoidales bacterium]
MENEGKTTALEVRDSQIVLTPDEVVQNATAQAKLLMDIVEKTKCYQSISGKKYLQVEAWETIGAFNRTHAETESITPIMRGEEIVGYQAHVKLWKGGISDGGAFMPCYFTENCCKGKAGDAKHKACMSAAQTFATSKAFRLSYSFVAILAGFQPTPAEELGDDEPAPKPPVVNEKAPGKPDGEKALTPRQQLLKAMRENQYTNDDIQAHMVDKYGKENSKELTEDEMLALVQAVQTGKVEKMSSSA